MNSFDTESTDNGIDLWQKSKKSGDFFFSFKDSPVSPSEIFSPLFPDKLRTLQIGDLSFEDATLTASTRDSGKGIEIVISSEGAKDLPLPSETIFQEHPDALIILRLEAHESKMNGPKRHNILYVSVHTDRPEIRGQGINSELYDHLGELAKKMGFRVIVGSNDFSKESHRNFFFGKLKRKTADVFKGKKKTEVFGNLMAGDHWSVQFLYPEDEAMFTQE